MRTLLFKFELMYRWSRDIYMGKHGHKNSAISYTNSSPNVTTVNVTVNDNVMQAY